MKKIFLLVVFVVLTFFQLKAQNAPWKFAHVSDTHVGNPTAIEDLRRTVKDINNNRELEFVIISGDITEFGADQELRTAKAILDSLNKPWYIIPGNHDMNWSESGGNNFKTIFGSETFAVKRHGYLFLGTNCGPNMRMSPGQVPRENIVWLDSVLKVTPKETRLIFVNHYPQDSSLNNWYDILDRLKTHNIELVICGHGHSNHHLNFEGIPGIMGRSNLRARDSIGGYNIVTVKGDSIFYNERIPGVETKPFWAKERLYNHHFSPDEHYARPSFAVNKQYADVKVKWSIQDNSDIGSGTAINGMNAAIANTAGWVKLYNVKNGKLIWAAKTGGKIYSTPCITANEVVVASTDKNLYCFDRRTGSVRWKTAFDKPVVASPVVKGNRVFCGSSDGHFKCFDLKSGKQLWSFDQVQGFVVTRPLLYGDLIYFGCWGNHFYALNQQTGALAWSWFDGYTNRMFSPAACYPVATANKLFIVAPDRSMTCFNAANGKVLWHKRADVHTRVRESMGLSADSSLVYVKTMDGDVLGISTQSDSMQVKWRGQKNMGYDISPSLVEEHGGIVFALSDKGTVYAFNRADGSLLWMHKLSNSLVNPLGFVNDRQLIATTMDGTITCLEY